MILNYFKTAWCNLVRGKFYSFVKVIDLSVGLTVCLLILLFTKDETSYDRFHTNGPRTYRIVQSWMFGKEEIPVSTTNAIMGESFSHDIAGIENYVRINGRPITVKKESDVFINQPAVTLHGAVHHKTNSVNPET